MDFESLREFWLNSDHIPCVMTDGRVAILIRGPSDIDPQFGFQVPGEPDIRWRQADQVERSGDALTEIAALSR